MVQKKLPQLATPGLGYREKPSSGPALDRPEVWYIIYFQPPKNIVTNSESQFWIFIFVLVATKRCAIEFGTDIEPSLI